MDQCPNKVAGPAADAANKQDPRASDMHFDRAGVAAERLVPSWQEINVADVCPRSNKLHSRSRVGYYRLLPVYLLRRNYGTAGTTLALSGSP